MSASILSLDDIQFSKIRHAAATWQSRRRACAIGNKELVDKFRADFALCKVVSFDVFDTLLVRSVGYPTDVFLFLDKHPAFSGHYWPQSLSQLRIEAEQRARQNLHMATGSAEVGLTEIYDALCDMVSAPRTLGVAWAEAEEVIEIQLCRPNPAIQQLYRIAQEAGTPILILSDTYHRRDFLIRLLASVGVNALPTQVYASSELRVNKQSGQLFEHVLKQQKLKAADVLHIGDHEISDFRTPCRIGLKAILHSHRAVSDSAQRFVSSSVAPLQSRIRAECAYQARCGKDAEDFWWLLGFEVFGAVISGFALWLHHEFLNDDIQRAYFLLRDGEIFFRVYRFLFEDSGPRAQLLHSSRRAFVFPLLNLSPKYAIESLTAGIGVRPANEYLTRLGVDIQQFKREFHAAGIPDHNTLLDARHDPRVGLLMRQPAIWEQLLEQSFEEKNCLLDYLRQERVFDTGRTALVDLGWNGTIHKAATMLMKEAGSEPDLGGYYLATFESFRNFLPADVMAKGYLAHLGNPASIASTLGMFRELLEIVCSSNSGSLINFQRDGSALRPQLLDNCTSKKHQIKLDSIHAGIMAFAASFRAMRRTDAYDEIPPLVAAERLLRVIAQPNKREAELIGSLVHSDDLGSTRARSVAEFRKQSKTAEELLADYEFCYWKAGLLKRSGPQTMVLRNILWLLED